MMFAAGISGRCPDCKVQEGWVQELDQDQRPEDLELGRCCRGFPGGGRTVGLKDYINEKTRERIWESLLPAFVVRMLLVVFKPVLSKRAIVKGMPEESMNTNTRIIDATLNTWSDVKLPVCALVVDNNRNIKDIAISNTEMPFSSYLAQCKIQLTYSIRTSVCHEHVSDNSRKVRYLREYRALREGFRSQLAL